MSLNGVIFLPTVPSQCLLSSGTSQPFPIIACRRRFRNFVTFSLCVPPHVSTLIPCSRPFPCPAKCTHLRVCQHPPRSPTKPRVGECEAFRDKLRNVPPESERH